MLKNRFFSNYFMLVAFISPFNFSKIVFAPWSCVRSLKFYYKNILSVVALKSLEIRLFYRKLKSRNRGNSLSVFHINFPKYRNDQRGKLDWNWLNFTARETQDYAPLQRQVTNNQANSHNFKTLNWIYSDFPCNFKVNRDKLALTNRRWMWKKGKRMTITANF